MASSASYLNFTTREVDVQFDPKGLKVSLEHFQQSIESVLMIMRSKDSLALHLNEPLEAQNRVELLKARSFQGRDPMVEEPSGIDSPPSTITWMELIQKVESDRFKPDLTCNVLYSCEYKGKIIKIFEKDKNKIEELQVLFTEKLAFQQDIVKERDVAVEMLSLVDNLFETCQRIPGEINKLKRELEGRIRLCQNEPLDVGTSNANNSPRTPSPTDDSMTTNERGDISVSTRALRPQRRPRITKSIVQSRNNSISSPRAGLSPIEASTDENYIPRSALEEDWAAEYLEDALKKNKPWPEIADEYAGIFNVRRSPAALSRYLNKQRRRARPRPEAISGIPTSTNKNPIPLTAREKTEGGRFVYAAILAGDSWDKVCDDYAKEFGIYRSKYGLGQLRSKYLKSIANSDCDETSSRSSEITRDVSTDSILTGVPRTIADSEEGTHWTEMREGLEGEGNNCAVKVQEEEDTLMADSIFRHSA